MIKEEHPDEFRKGYEFLQQQKILDSNKVKVKFWYGNTHEKIKIESGNKHRWGMFVKCADKRFKDG